MSYTRKEMKNTLKRYIETFYDTEVVEESKEYFKIKNGSKYFKIDVSEIVED